MNFKGQLNKGQAYQTNWWKPKATKQSSRATSNQTNSLNAFNTAFKNSLTVNFTTTLVPLLN